MNEYMRGITLGGLLTEDEGIEVFTATYNEVSAAEKEGRKSNHEEVYTKALTDVMIRKQLGVTSPPKAERGFPVEDCQVNPLTQEQYAKVEALWREEELNAKFVGRKPNKEVLFEALAKVIVSNLPKNTIH